MADEPTAQEVKFVQQFLAGTGHYTGGQTGEFDNATYEALVAWQRERGLSVSGRIDLATTSAMASGIQQIARIAVDPVDQKILEQYGPAMYAYRLHPEIGNILRWSAAANYDEARLWGLLEQTEWYRETSNAQRRWDDLNVADPAEAGRQREERAGLISDRARRMGVQLTERDLGELVEDSLVGGWSADGNEVDDALAAFVPENGTGVVDSGTIAVDAGALQSEARRWLVTLSSVEAQNLAAQIARGEMTPEGAGMLFRERAKARFPYANLASLIDQGIAPEDYFREHQNQIANRLGISPEAVDWTERRWQGILDFVDDRGNRRPMTIPESMAHLASRLDLFPEYDRAPESTAAAATLARNLRETFEGVR